MQAVVAGLRRDRSAGNHDCVVAMDAVVRRVKRQRAACDLQIRLRLYTLLGRRVRIARAVLPADEPIVPRFHRCIRAAAARCDVQLAARNERARLRLYAVTARVNGKHPAADIDEALILFRFGRLYAVALRGNIDCPVKNLDAVLAGHAVGDAALRTLRQA